MNDFEDEDEDDCNDANINKQITVCGISFEQLKTNMTDIFGNGKVNCFFFIVFCIFLVFKKNNVFFNFIGYEINKTKRCWIYCAI